MRTILCIVLIAANTTLSEFRAEKPTQSTDIPESVLKVFKSSGLDRQFDFSSPLKPSFLSGDFDGDSKPDVAVLVKQKKSGKIGIAVCHSSNGKVLFIGAGTEVGNGGDNFDWMDSWSVTPKASAKKKVGRTGAGLLKGDALHVEKSESASALIFWNGRRYVWNQQGD
jgi:hypothetical protein